MRGSGSSQAADYAVASRLDGHHSILFFDMSAPARTERIMGHMEQSAERRHIQTSGVAARTAEDFACALRRLSDGDLLRLEALARLRARGLPGDIAWSDLLHEAIRRALDGSRPWPPGVPLVAFLAQVMRSIWSEYCRRNARERRLARMVSTSVGDCEVNEMDPERIVGAAAALVGIYRLFADDGAALGVIAGLADGLTGEEICKACRMSPTDYKTTRKRIRRRLLRSKLMWAVP
jgi:RNA polymerase sigma-70 factor (ECF subfamily)